MSFSLFVVAYLGLSTVASLWAARVLELPFKDYWKKYSTENCKAIRYSIESIFIFSLVSLFLWVSKYNGWFFQFHLEFHWKQFLPEALVMIVWNEIHFYFAHRFLHLPWVYKYSHSRHHEFVHPTPYSSYAFHWLEAVVLGTPFLFIMPFYEFSVWGILSLPTYSLFLNVIAHSDVADRIGTSYWSIKSFAKRHFYHHTKFSKSYGFFFPYFDHYLNKKNNTEVSHEV